MGNLDAIKSAWLESMETLGKTPWFRRLATAELSIEHYKSLLRETYFQAGQNPQLQAYAAGFFPQGKRQLVKKFCQHAIGEIGHDLLALEDLKALGESVDAIVAGKALPETTALTAYAYYSIQFVNPVSYLGYLFHLEFMPTQNGEKYITLLKKVGVPDTALTFLREHATVDIAHNKLMEKYIEELVQPGKTLDVVIEAVQTTCKLHGNMISAAFDRVGA